MTSSARLRIAFVSDAVYPFHKGGKEVRLHEIARRLAARGHDVTVFTMQWWPRTREITVDGVRLRAICRAHPLYSGRRRSFREAVAFGAAVLQLFTYEFDVVDVDHMPFFPLFTTKVVSLAKRRPLVGTWHEVWGADYWREYLGPSGHLAYRLEHAAARIPDHIVAVSAQTAQRLSTVLGRPREVSAIPLGVDFERILTSVPAATGSDVVFAGRLLENKRVEVLIDAVAALHVEGHPITAHVIGEGPERHRLETLAASSGVGSAVRFSDFFETQDELFSVMKASRVFVSPSVREGFGLGVLEANACGLPVVVSDDPGNASRLLIDDGINGFAVPSNAADVAKAILRCLEVDGSAPRRCLECGHLETYRWDTVADHIEDLFIQLARHHAA